MIIAFRINTELTCEKVCIAIQKLLNNNDSVDKILTIEVKEVSQTTNEFIPKLTYKKEDD